MYNDNPYIYILSKTLNGYVILGIIIIFCYFINYRSKINREAFLERINKRDKINVNNKKKKVKKNVKRNVNINQKDLKNKKKGTKQNSGKGNSNKIEGFQVNRTNIKLITDLNLSEEKEKFLINYYNENIIKLVKSEIDVLLLDIDFNDNQDITEFRESRDRIINLYSRKLIDHYNSKLDTNDRLYYITKDRIVLYLRDAKSIINTSLESLYKSIINDYTKTIDNLNENIGSIYDENHEQLQNNLKNIENNQKKLETSILNYNLVFNKDIIRNYDDYLNNKILNSKLQPPNEYQIDKQNIRLNTEFQGDEEDMTKKYGQFYTQVLQTQQDDELKLNIPDLAMQVEQGFLNIGEGINNLLFESKSNQVRAKAEFKNTNDKTNNYSRFNLLNNSDTIGSHLKSTDISESYNNSNTYANTYNNIHNDPYTNINNDTESFNINNIEGFSDKSIVIDNFNSSKNGITFTFTYKGSKEYDKALIVYSIINNDKKIIISKKKHISLVPDYTSTLQLNPQNDLDSGNYKMTFNILSNEKKISSTSYDFVIDKDLSEKIFSGEIVTNTLEYGLDSSKKMLNKYNKNFDKVNELISSNDNMIPFGMVLIIISMLLYFIDITS